MMYDYIYNLLVDIILIIAVAMMMSTLADYNFIVIMGYLIIGILLINIIKNKITWIRWIIKS